MELSVHQDKIINTFNRLASREKDRATDVGEDREEIGALIEFTGLHKKAVSFARMLHKQEPEKRDDILRSLHPLLAMMEAHWGGQKTPDMFETAAEAADDEASDDAYGDGDDELREESDEFESHLAAIEEDNAA